MLPFNSRFLLILLRFNLAEETGVFNLQKQMTSDNTLTIIIKLYSIQLFELQGKLAVVENLQVNKSIMLYINLIIHRH